uniref:Uncharacterized protein n=1 Tax=Panagrolaimus sp. ES5 TaxID=591445 RepID=A0AC34FV61_9BILA
MQKKLKFLQLLFLCFNQIQFINSLVCYSCTSTLSSTVDEAGQLALRIFLDSTYLLPSVHRLCNMEEDLDFKTIPVSQCPYKDNCVKISASNQGKLRIC